MLMTQQQQFYEFWHKVLVTREAMLKDTTKSSSNESLFAYKVAKVNNRNNQALDRKGSRTTQSQTDTS